MLLQVRSGQVRSECLPCTFRASCCSTHLPRAQVPAFAGSSVWDRGKKGGGSKGGGAVLLHDCSPVVQVWPFLPTMPCRHFLFNDSANYLFNDLKCVQNKRLLVLNGMT